MNQTQDLWPWILMFIPPIIMLVVLVFFYLRVWRVIAASSKAPSRRKVILIVIVWALIGGPLIFLIYRKPPPAPAVPGQPLSIVSLILPGVILSVIVARIAWMIWQNHDRVISAANRKAQAGDVDGAIAELQASLATEPPTFPRLNSLGTLLLKKDRHAEALEAFDEALAMVREKVSGPKVDHFSVCMLQNNRGAALVKLDRFEEGLEAHNAAQSSLNALNADPSTFVNSLVDYLNLDGRARCLAKLGRVQEATEAFRASEVLFQKVVKQHGGEQKATLVKNFEGTKALVKPEAAGLGDDFA